jgi:tetratricopeptide (TPR) repeat protein
MVLVMFAIHQHQLAMERTRIKFNVTMYETNVLEDAFATLDNQPVTSGDNISLGSHILVISHRKGEPFTTNFFAWYGGLDCGKVNLKRAMGFLNISAKPAARSITISGPEFSQTLNDSKGINMLVPTDNYRIRCEYERWNDEVNWAVNPGNNRTCIFDPHLGDLSITSSDMPATFQVSNQNGQLIEQGDLPATVTGLPSAIYQVTIEHNGHRLKRSSFVAQEKANTLPVEFAFGAVNLESHPSGAAVYAGGNYLGTTPLDVKELDPGLVHFQIQSPGYANADVSANVTANETVMVSSNLVSLDYVERMRGAQNSMASGDYHRAVTDLEQALTARPDDTEALRLHPIAKGHEFIQTATELAAQGDFIGAGDKLKSALEILPDDGEAQKLQADYLKHVPEQKVRMKEVQSREAFNRVCAASPGSRYFDSHEILCGTRPADEARDAIVRTFGNEMPAFKVVRYVSLADGNYEVDMLQDAENQWSTMRRELLMVIGSGKDGQTAVYYKVNEYQRKAVLNVNITLNSINTNDRPEDWIPVHPSRIRMTPVLSNQVAMGIHMADRIIRMAVGTNMEGQ